MPASYSRLLAGASEENLSWVSLPPEGAYSHSGGWNWRAVGGTLLGCTLAWDWAGGAALRPLYDYAWFIGFGTEALRHLF